MNFFVTPNGVHAFHSGGAWNQHAIVGPSASYGPQVHEDHMGARGTLAGQLLSFGPPKQSFGTPSGPTGTSAPMQAPTITVGWSTTQLVLAGLLGLGLGLVIGWQFGAASVVARGVATAAAAALPRVVPHLLGAGSEAQS